MDNQKSTQQSQVRDITKMSKLDIQVYLDVLKMKERTGMVLPEDTEFASSDNIISQNSDLSDGLLPSDLLEQVRSYVNVSSEDDITDLEEFINLGFDKIMTSIDADDIELRKRMTYAKGVTIRLAELIAY